MRKFPFLCFLTEIQTVQQNVFIFIPCKNIKPFDNGKTNEIGGVGIMRFVIATHVTNKGNYNVYEKNKVS